MNRKRSPAELSVLHMLLDADGGMTVREIAERITYDRNTVGYTLRSLSGPDAAVRLAEIVGSRPHRGGGKASQLWALRPEAREQVAALFPNRTGPPVHEYLSTGCLHGEHGYCKGDTGAVGAKRPAECKWCGAPCLCTCHQGTPNAG